VSAIIGPKLCQNLAHVSFDGFFRNLKIVGSDLVGVAVALPWKSIRVDPELCFTGQL
jgi:hypothetical protein